MTLSTGLSRNKLKTITKNAKSAVITPKYSLFHTPHITPVTVFRFRYTGCAGRLLVAVEVLGDAIVFCRAFGS